LPFLALLPLIDLMSGEDRNRPTPVIPGIQVDFRVAAKVTVQAQQFVFTISADRGSFMSMHKYPILEQFPGFHFAKSFEKRRRLPQS
jgi:hypothetical protein